MQLDLADFGEHELVQIIYTSRNLLKGTQAEVSAAVAAILEKSRSENLRRGITGVLFFNGRCFAQTLEGPPREIERLYAHLLKDPRHTQLRVLQQGAIGVRCFNGWAMAFVEGGEGQAFLIPSGFLRDVVRENGGAAGTVLEKLRFLMQDS